MGTVIREIYCTATAEKISISAGKGPQHSSDIDKMETIIEIVGTGYSITLTGSEALRMVQAVMERLNGAYAVHDLDDDLFQAPFGPGSSSDRRTWPTTTPKEAAQQYADREAEEKARMYHELHAHLGLINEAAVHCGMSKAEFEKKMKKYNIVYEPPIADDLPF